MTTEKQAAANRRNAKKSTGPRTDEGKVSSSQNALRHGLSAERVVIWGEDPAAYEALRSSIVRHYQPDDPIAVYLVDEVASCIWRLRRVPEIEAGIYASFMKQAQPWEDYIREQMGSRDVDIEASDNKIRTQRVTAETKGWVFGQSERLLTSLYRLTTQTQNALHRSIRELERMKAERSESTNQPPIIDAEPDQQPAIPRPRPHLSMKAEGSESTSQPPLIDAEPDQQPVIPRPRPHLSKRGNARPTMSAEEMSEFLEQFPSRR